MNEVLPNVQNVDMQRDYVAKTRLSLQRMIEEYKALLEQFNFFLNKLFSLLNKTQRNKQKCTQQLNGDNDDYM